MNETVKVKSIEHDNDSRILKIRWHDGRDSSFAYIWLRHYCNYPVLGRAEQKDDASCKIPEPPTLPSIRSVNLEDSQIFINWAHDQNRTKHPLQLLRGHSLRKSNQRNSLKLPTLWNGNEARQFGWFEFDDIKHPDSLLRLFHRLRSHGLALVRNLPTETNTLFDIAAHFGPIRRTHFGEIFDIRSLPPDQKGTGANIGATAANSQAPHMDEGWRHGPPGISFFHCLKSHKKGGASQFVDGIAAAEKLREFSPESFNFLSNIPLLMAAERNPQERFRNRGRVIVTDHDDIVRGVRVSDRNFPPIDYLPDNQVETAYQAMHDFAQCVYAEERVFEHLLKPGELVIFDNHRVLHARRAFDPAAGERWIQQLSVDREEFHNVYRQLAERLGDNSTKYWEPDAGLLSQSSTK